jgi:hypothetical protein
VHLGTSILGRYEGSLWVKIPMLHLEYWAMYMVDTKLVKEEDASKIMCGCWSIWSERNARRHEEGRRSMTNSVRWVMQTTLDLAQIGKEKGKKLPRRKTAGRQV